MPGAMSHEEELQPWGGGGTDGALCEPIGGSGRRRSLGERGRLVREWRADRCRCGRCPATRRRSLSKALRQIVPCRETSSRSIGGDSVGRRLVGSAWRGRHTSRSRCSNERCRRGICCWSHALGRLVTCWLVSSTNRGIRVRVGRLLRLDWSRNRRGLRCIRVVYTGPGGQSSARMSAAGHRQMVVEAEVWRQLGL